MEGLPRLFLVIGLVFVGIALWLQFGPSIPWLGRLPGDIHIEGTHGSFYFPITTSLLVSVVLSLLLWIFSNLR